MFEEITELLFIIFLNPKSDKFILIFNHRKKIIMLLQCLILENGSGDEC